MTTITEDAPAQAGAAPKAKPVKRHPCGFCATRHHSLCPGTVRNGSATKNPTWSCICAETGHALGGQPPLVANVVRMNPAVLADIRNAVAAAHAGRDEGRKHRHQNTPAPPAAGVTLYRKCVECGWDFGHEIERDRCGSPKMCAKRKELGDPSYGRRKAR